MRVSRMCLLASFLGGALTACGPSPSAGSDPSGTAAPIDYGVLGKPDADPGIDGRSAAENLKLFRGDDKNPPQGTEAHPIDWMTQIEQGLTQRALFYAAAKSEPSLITDQDRKWVKADEDEVLSNACGNRGAPGVPLQLSEQQCAGVK